MTIDLREHRVVARARGNVDVGPLRHAGYVPEQPLGAPDNANDLVQRLWLAHTGSRNVAALRRRLEAVEPPERIRSILSEFLQSGGD